MQITIKNSAGYEALRNIKFPVTVNAEYLKVEDTPSNRLFKYIVVKEEEFMNLEGYVFDASPFEDQSLEIEFYFSVTEYVIQES